MELVVLGEDLNHITEITDEPNLKNKEYIPRPRSMPQE